MKFGGNKTLFRNKVLSQIIYWAAICSSTRLTQYVWWNIYLQRKNDEKPKIDYSIRRETLNNFVRAVRRSHNTEYTIFQFGTQKSTGTRNSNFESLLNVNRDNDIHSYNNNNKENSSYHMENRRGKNDRIQPQQKTKLNQ